MSENNPYAKLAWQCRRGMLELDVILIPFLQQHFSALGEQQKADFERLLEEADPDLYTWLMGYGSSDDAALQLSVELIRDKMQIGR